MKSSSSAGPRSPAFSEFWLSLTATPWFVVRPRPPESTRTRDSRSLPGLKPATAGLPVFGVALLSVNVLAATFGSNSSTLCLTGGRSDSLPYSLRFAALNGNLSAPLSVASSLAAAKSPPARDRRDGPLTVLREDDFVSAAAPRPPLLRTLARAATGRRATPFGRESLPFLAMALPCALR